MWNNSSSYLRLSTCRRSSTCNLVQRDLALQGMCSNEVRLSPLTGRDCDGDGLQHDTEGSQHYSTSNSLWIIGCALTGTHVDVQQRQAHSTCLPGNADALVDAYSPPGVTVGVGNLTRKTIAQPSCCMLWGVVDGLSWKVVILNISLGLPGKLLF